jgi:hypothetical protein
LAQGDASHAYAVRLSRLGKPAAGAAIHTQSSGNARRADGLVIRCEELEDEELLMAGNDDKIRQRAYELWEQSGKEGSEMDFWLQAEKEIAERDSAAAPPQDRLE